MSLKNIILDDLYSPRNHRKLKQYMAEQFGELKLPDQHVYEQFKKNNESSKSTKSNSVVKDWCNNLFEEPLKVVGIFCKLFDANEYLKITNEFDLKTWANQLTIRDYLINRINMDSLFASCQPTNNEGYRSLTINFFGLFDILQNIKGITYDWEAKLLHPTTLHEILALQCFLPPEFKGMSLPESNYKDGNGIQKTSELDKISVNDYLNDQTINIGGGVTGGRAIEEMSSHNVGGSRRRLTINIEAHYDVLLEQFSNWLRKEQKQNNIKSTRLKFTRTDVARWKKINLLAYIDLEILRLLLQKLCGINFSFTQGEYSKILYQGDLDASQHKDRMKTLDREYKRVITDTSLSTMLSMG